MDTWAERITECIEQDEKRHYLKGIPLTLVASEKYLKDTWYWIDYKKANLN